MSFKKLILLSVLFITGSFSSYAQSSSGLVIHAAEIGIGKFHRHDNQVHTYDEDNIWLNYALPEDADLETPLTIENQNQSVTIFFSNLEELLKEVIRVSEEKETPVSVLNINAHGMPGAMWFPVDEKDQKSASCSDWREAAKGNDEDNYDQYYSPIDKSEILSLRLLSKLPSMQFTAPCTNGAGDWKSVIKRNPEIKNVFASNAQLHFFSCVVGLGWAGERFTESVAKNLFTGEGAKVESSMNFGLGDWSMPEGMGFWDYLDDDQLDHDNELYPVDREDREMMQKGQIRLALNTNSKWKVGIVGDLDFMYGDQDDLTFSSAELLSEPTTDFTLEEIQNMKLPIHQLHIPHTKVKISLTAKK